MKSKILVLLALILTMAPLSARADEAYNSYTNTTCQDNDELAGYRSAGGMLNYTCQSLADYVVAETVDDNSTHVTMSLTGDSSQIIVDSNATNTGTYTHSTLTAPRTWTFPDTSGSVVIAGGTNTLSNKTLDSTNKFGISLTAAASNNFTIMEVGYLNGSGQVVEADASASATSLGMLVVANGTINGGASGTFVPLGFVTTSGLTAGATYYVSETTGAVTTTKPTAPGTIVRIVGYAVSSTVFYANPDHSYVEN